MAGQIQKVIDVDVHQMLPSGQALLPYLPEPWKSRYAKTGSGGSGMNLHNPVGVIRQDCRPPSGGPTASDPDFMVQDLLKPYNIERVVLTGDMMGISTGHDPDFSAAIASAYNDHLVEYWLNTKHEHYVGSILVSSFDAHLAAREIDRMADHPKMVGVIMCSGQRNLLGQRNFYPIYEAASRHGLPVAIHPGNEGAGGTPPPTGHGYPTRYLEWHTSLSQNYMAQLTSLICEGVFEKFPKLKFVLLEGGIAWLPGLMWQMDKAYKQLRATMPWLKRLPSEYIRDHCYLSTQPIEEPDDPKQLMTIFDMIDAENFLMFSTDYPHWDNDMPTEILKKLRPEHKQKIYYDNAKKLYNL
ncbi:amidohydrolase [Paenibacillus hemerocallicola]|uniref:Amidohydrolase n=1 Tax=Paenibacillus hemerocallicola TaxID=1172614 RepID=A0A5C4T0M6_9BACL|nr:amidohydrolase family protein [Paenibacillus hemerocallicola]TNJ61597.1 amidohydrolase [Paenibacillus hemerocallicola]